MGSGGGNWAGYLARRLGGMVLVLFGVVVITFFVTRKLGTPVYLLVGQQADKETIEAIRHQIGLDRPLLDQFGTYLGQLVTGDLGVSRVTGHSVVHDIRQYLPATIELVVAAMLITVAVAVPMGIRGATHPRGIADRIGQALSQLGASVPNFWIGLILIYIFYFLLGVAPSPSGELGDTVPPPPRVTGFMLVDSLADGNLRAFGSAVGHLIMPALTLSLVSIPATLQITRATFIGILGSDYIRTARASGMPRGMTLYKYALKNAVVSIVTVLAMSFGFLMSGTVLVESIYSWPGIGLYALNATKNFDYEPVIGVVLLSAFVYAIAYLLADVIAVIVDPRIRTEGASG
jgi:peptide/nickel transport system permease protein